MRRAKALTLLFAFCFCSCLATSKENLNVANANAVDRQDKKKMDSVTQDIFLTCRAEVEEKILRVSYTLQTKRIKEIYVLDVFPAVNQEERTAYADYQSVLVSSKDGGVANLLKGIPPLPRDKTVAVRVMPLGTKLSQGGSVERSFEIELPLREQSPWYYLPLEDEKEYQKGTVNTLILNVDIMSSTAEGFKAEPVDYAEGLFRVRSQNTVGHAERFKCKMTIPEMPFLIRTDLFSRL